MSGRWIFDPSRPPGQRMVAVPLDWRPTPRPRVAVHGVKPDFYSHADGKHYSDTRTYEREVRARGYEIKGNERLNPPDPIEQTEVGFREALIETCREGGDSIEGSFPHA